MKKVVALLFALMLGLSLAACKDDTTLIAVLIPGADHGFTGESVSHAIAGTERLAVENGFEYKVLTSSTDNSPSSFTKINDGNYISVPDADWTEYTFEIPATAKYFAFNCVSDDAFILLLDDITFSGTVAVEEAVITSSIYPNPATDFVTISTQENINKVEVYNVLGQLVYANEEGNNQVMVNVADFSNGVYVAKVYTNSGVSTKKFNVLR